MVFSTKARAVAAMPKFMDEHCPHGKDWRNGLKGFGRRKEENYLYYQYFGNEIGDDGVLLSKTINPMETRISFPFISNGCSLIHPMLGMKCLLLLKRRMMMKKMTMTKMMLMTNDGNYGVSRLMLRDSDTLLEHG